MGHKAAYYVTGKFALQRVKYYDLKPKRALCAQDCHNYKTTKMANFYTSAKAQAANAAKWIWNNILKAYIKTKLIENVPKLFDFILKFIIDLF
jgi:hypothetical protein